MVPVAAVGETAAVRVTDSLCSGEAVEDVRVVVVEVVPVEVLLVVDLVALHPIDRVRASRTTMVATAE
jgi:hypothetical protein